MPDDQERIEKLERNMRLLLVRFYSLAQAIISLTHQVDVINTALPAK